VRFDCSYLTKLSGKKLLPPKEYHCYGDWLSHNADIPKGVVYMAYFAHSADLMSRIAKIIGKKSDANKYEKLLENIKIAFNKKYVDKNYKIKGLNVFFWGDDFVLY
jgi:alpha-L-rhamnosidase